MSRIGRRPIEIPDGVTVEIGAGVVSVKGPKGELSQSVSPSMRIEQSNGTLTVERPSDRGEHRALHGLTRSLVANMEMSLGYSHPVTVEAPEGIEFEVPQPTEVVVRGIDKQLVGETAARVRKQRPPEPYKGKGVRYSGEYVRRKVGKRA